MLLHYEMQLFPFEMSFENDRLVGSFYFLFSSPILFWKHLVMQRLSGIIIQGGIHLLKVVNFLIHIMG